MNSSNIYSHLSVYCLLFIFPLNRISRITKSVCDSFRLVLIYLQIKSPIVGVSSGHFGMFRAGSDVRGIYYNFVFFSSSSFWQWAGQLKSHDNRISTRPSSVLMDTVAKLRTKRGSVMLMPQTVQP